MSMGREYLVLMNRNQTECDLFLMSPPTSGDYKKSDQNHLYLYKNEKEQIFYRIQDSVFKLEIPQSIKGKKEFKFEQSEIKPVKCENLEICTTVLGMTSKARHTHQTKSESYKFNGTDFTKEIETLKKKVEAAKAEFAAAEQEYAAAEQEYLDEKLNKEIETAKAEFEAAKQELDKKTGATKAEFATAKQKYLDKKNLLLNKLFFFSSSSSTVSKPSKKKLECFREELDDKSYVHLILQNKLDLLLFILKGPIKTPQAFDKKINEFFKGKDCNLKLHLLEGSTNEVLNKMYKIIGGEIENDYFPQDLKDYIYNVQLSKAGATMGYRIANPYGI